MTRFDADAPEERQKLFAEGIAAHRERGSPFATFEAHRDASASAGIGDDTDKTEDSEAGNAGDAEGGDAEAEEDESEVEEDEPEEFPPWIQFGDGVLNLDCTDDELDDLKSLLGDFPAFKIDDLNRPEETEGVNARVSALADPNRVAQCVERVFREVYDQPEGYRVWITEI